MTFLAMHVRKKLFALAAAQEASLYEELSHFRDI
jgi:hypothetical protein